jgi:hypothetical protein
MPPASTDQYCLYGCRALVARWQHILRDVCSPPRISNMGAGRVQVACKQQPRWMLVWHVDDSCMTKVYAVRTL